LCSPTSKGSDTVPRQASIRTFLAGQGPARKIL